MNFAAHIGVIYDNQSNSRNIDLVVRDKVLVYLTTSCICLKVIVIRVNKTYNRAQTASWHL